MSLPPDDTFEWVFSDEHFAEMYRGDSALADELLEILARARVRMITLELTPDWEIKNEATVLGFQHPKDLYARFLDSVGEHSEACPNFNPMLAYLHGNTGALNPAEFARKFRETLRALASDIPDDMLEASYPEGHESLIVALTESLEEALDSAKEHLSPIDKTRRRFTKKQLTNLEEDDGPIIDQISAIVGKTLVELEKDQFFGKVKLQLESETMERNPVFLGIARCYWVLNYVGYWPDRKMAKPSSIPGINSDAAHVGYGAYCSAIASEDLRLCKKARAAYDYFNCGTRVLHVVFDPG